MIRRPPRSTLFPSRRSSDLTLAALCAGFAVEWSLFREIADVGSGDERLWACAREDRPFDVRFGRKSIGGLTRSEEHTSELQSQSNLVCRLLLEKKNTDNNTA